MKDGTWKALFSMGLLAMLEAVDMLTHGPDGALFGAVVAAIAGLGGFAIGRSGTAAPSNPGP